MSPQSTGQNGFNEGRQVIAQYVDNKMPWRAPARNDSVSQLRLIQVEFAVRDDRAKIGWVFGTFMYDSENREENVLQQDLC